MEHYRDRTFDEERALYGSDGVLLESCRFDGPADGESALKESRNIEARDCWFNLRYPFWHDTHVKIVGGEMTAFCRAALWYSEDIALSDLKMHGIKALRECEAVRIDRCDIASPEFGWSVRGITARDTTAEGEYFMMRAERLSFRNVTLKGKYAFQYIRDAVFENCTFDTKDAFWHAENVTVKNSVIRGEYLAWYSRNVTFENCTLIGTQPLCYCKGLKLVQCRMLGADLAFEKSEADASVTTPVISIKNPRAGRIVVPGVNALIWDDPLAKGQVLIDDEGRQTAKASDPEGGII